MSIFKFSIATTLLLILAIMMIVCFMIIVVIHLKESNRLCYPTGEDALTGLGLNESQKKILFEDILEKAKIQNKGNSKCISPKNFTITFFDGELKVGDHPEELDKPYDNVDSCGSVPATEKENNFLKSSTA